MHLTFLEPNGGSASTYWGVNPRPDGATDAALLHLVACGDEQALAELYDRHAAWLVARLHRRCASDDVVDLSFVKEASKELGPYVKKTAAK